MKRADIKVGEEYAAGKVSRSDLAHVVVRELAGERTVKRSWGGTEVQRGVVVEIIDTPYSFPEPGGEAVYSSREIVRPWAEHVERVAAEKVAADARYAERERLATVAAGCRERLVELGFDAGQDFSGWSADVRLTLDALVRLLAMVPDGTTRGATR